MIKEGQKHIPHHIAYCARCGRHIGPIESYINGEIIICHDCLEENKKPKKQIIAEIRKSFELFGLNTSEFTDDELEKSITEMTKLIMKTGVSIKQANDAFLYLTTNNRQT
ncbi:hypothetical protein KA005_15520 [bacterium]|nr:hypothetical protein [bacterium]